MIIYLIANHGFRGLKYNDGKFIDLAPKKFTLGRHTNEHFKSRVISVAGMRQGGMNLKGKKQLPREEFLSCLNSGAISSVQGIHKVIEMRKDMLNIGNY